MVNRYEDLEIYQVSVEVAIEVYRLTKKFPKEETYGIVDQLKRAVTSIGANIAEGFGRFYFKDKLVFFYHSRGSLFEVKHFLEISFRMGYITNEEKNSLFVKLNNLSVKLNNFISSIGKQNGS
ncbi:MAG: S23 ribosomal protein [Candidatus Amesbacteria bacterium GW2011_GWA1_47_20]|uniref:S23 ribosomal protein n=2 Tax=Candidatus Amesiibacteriota TaxID=1752730 RepID=A0A0G1SJW3_9BACT|nr:MAG: S23 ribosomal protein [Microgenomates group bacterium GW2011_GWC1_46_20]KKU69717.1 MAG: S23 ribosomal protein [Candidatus Amesbacteria bacterium GW2011_GWA1_47_20]KKU82914.1 MAG: S23 ribosomal protein [Candidatus Amesbacteria bacterium GW2011_GWC2_47_8]